MQPFSSLQDEDKYRFGLTKIFFRAGQVAYLERLRSNRLHSSGVLIQKHIRGWLQRKKFVSLRQATIHVQAHARGLLARRWVGLIELVLVRFTVRWRPTLRVCNYVILLRRKNDLIMCCCPLYIVFVTWYSLPVSNTHTRTQACWISSTDTCSNTHSETHPVFRCLPTLPQAPPCHDHHPGLLPGAPGSQGVHCTSTRDKGCRVTALPARVASSQSVPVLFEVHCEDTMLCASMAGKEGTQAAKDPGTLSRPPQEAQPRNGEQNHRTAAEAHQAGWLPWQPHHYDVWWSHS